MSAASCVATASTQVRRCAGQAFTLPAHGSHWWVPESCLTLALSFQAGKMEISGKARMLLTFQSEVYPFQPLKEAGFGDAGMVWPLNVAGW